MASAHPEYDTLSFRAPHPGDLMAVWPAAPPFLSRVRGAVRSWLARHDWPREPADDIVLAADEAMANAIVHAYRPATATDVTVAARVHLHAWVSVQPRIRARRVVVTVRDRGQWRPDPHGVTMPGRRGHGLMMMNGVMADTHIQRSPTGTTVILVSPTETAQPTNLGDAGTWQ